ncbi:DUF4105 domain-containing protein [Aureimonas populi]|uniref:DUF4105 domain-containing protein n=1 Tax=Aureimonas populi TaxID=1701758 RepID=A0ABW5CP14_9HYPH|nr:DUF4105 domain-containing protein [Aureimonas populi]
MSEPAGARRRPLARAAFAGFVLLAALWAVMAVRFQFEGPARWALWGVVATAAGTLLWLHFGGRRRAGWAGFAAAIAVAALWWASIDPLPDRDWAPDVSRGVTARIEGSTAVLDNVRDFEWRTEEDFTERWETRSYDLDTLSFVDLVSSTWGNPAIAHTLVSFGFDNGETVTFSAEIRRERGEAFSELGGFFKQFELVMIAAQESDIVRLRTNARREDVSLYPLDLTAEQRRALFLAYLERANELAAEPAFYHTIIANCTTIIFQLARLVEPGIPMDWRILLSGYLVDYLHEHGVTGAGLPLEEVRERGRISAVAQGAPASADYSSVIRGPESLPRP